MSVGHGVLAELDLAQILALLAPEAVAAVVHVLGALVHGRRSGAADQGAAGNIPTQGKSYSNSKNTEK